MKNSKVYGWKNPIFFLILQFFIPRPLWRTFKLQVKPLALEREHPALQNLNFFHFFLLLCVTFALLDSVPYSADQNHCESMQIRIHITDLQVQILPCSRAGSGSNILGKKSLRIRILAAGLPDGSSDIVCCTLQSLCFPSLVGTVSLMSWIRNIKN